MLSYRHAFHAGNHADVLKHLVLSLCLTHMNAKDKAYLALDTHAGAGRYALDSETAKKTGEYLDGIGRLWGREDVPPALATYLAAVRASNGQGRLHLYPGSPWLLAHLAREGDSLRFCERHGSDFALLRREFGEADRRVRIEQGDGFAALKAALPPPQRRGLVLIDPSYEIKSDYLQVLTALKDALKRFATGCYLIWHPFLPTIEARQLPEKLKKLPTDWLYASLSVRAPSNQGRGMHGSGMFIVNPPWTLAASLRETLPWLTDTLAQDGRAGWQVLCANEEAPAPPTAPPRQRRVSTR